MTGREEVPCGWRASPVAEAAGASGGAAIDGFSFAPFQFLSAAARHAPRLFPESRAAPDAAEPSYAGPAASSFSASTWISSVTLPSGIALPTP